MGEIAEMMLEGVLCEGCGVALDDGEAPGYPRRCSGCGVPAQLYGPPGYRGPERKRRRWTRRRGKNQRYGG